SYSANQRNILLEIVRPEVERQMALEGKDFNDPRFLGEYNHRIETRLELMLVERGLPTNKEFLFSGPSLMRSIAHLMGYKVDREKLYQSRDFKPDMDLSGIPENERRELLQKAERERRISSQIDRLLREAAQFPENATEYEQLKRSAETFKTALVRNLEAQF